MGMGRAHHWMLDRGWKGACAVRQYDPIARGVMPSAATVPTQRQSL